MITSDDKVFVEGRRQGTLSSKKKAALLEDPKSLGDDVKPPKIYLLIGDFPDQDINELYNHPKIKAMVSLTKGEGFGRPLLEFSLVNKPIITTGWSGHMDFLKPEFVALVGGKLEKLDPSSVVKDMLIPESAWFSPDHNQIGGCYQEIYSNIKQWNEKAKRQGFHSRSKFSFDVMKKQIKSFIKDTIPNLPKKMELNLDGISNITMPKKQKVNG